MSLIMDSLDKVGRQGAESRSFTTNTSFSTSTPGSGRQEGRTRVYAAASAVMLLMLAASAGGLVWLTWPRFDSALVRQNPAMVETRKPARVEIHQGPLKAYEQEPFRTHVPIEGVVIDARRAWCLIDGKILKAGDTWQGYRIVEIGTEGVMMETPSGTAAFYGVKS